MSMTKELLELHILDNEFVFFKHHDEDVPFLAIRCDKMEIHTDYVKLYSEDYIEPICTVHEYGKWFMLEKSDPFLLKDVQIKYINELTEL